MEEYEILEELKMHIRCSEFAQKLFCDGVSVDFLKSTLDLILKQKEEIEKNKAAGNVSDKHGHWIYLDGNDEYDDDDDCFYSVYGCSCCGKIKRECDLTDYCPNCGAKMYKEYEND